MIRAAWLRQRAPALLALGVLCNAAAASAADFNPEGRRKRPAPSRPAARPSAPAPPARADEPAVLIRRYLDQLARDPGAEFPLERLVQLHRQRDGSLDALIAEFEARAAREGPSGHAAKLSLAGIYVHAGEGAKAEQLYEAVLRAAPKSEVAARRLALLLAARGDLRGARDRLAPALSLKAPDSVHEQNLRTLITWSLDLSDLAAARGYHAELVRRSGNSFFVRAELGRLLFDRRLFEAAEEEYRRVVESSRGDARSEAPALRDHGRALGALGRNDEALKVLAEAERKSARESGLRLEILRSMIDVHRASDRLPELVARLEREGAGDFDRLVLLAGLYAETGKVERARRSYEAALRLRPSSAEVRLEVVRLLELSGELEAVIGHYRQLIQGAPKNPVYTFRLAEALLQRGEQAAALRALGELEARSAEDDDTLGAIVDFYERMGEPARALALLERLAAGDDERHLVELGDRYYARGETERALSVWQRLGRDPNDARALHALGRVYLDHDLTDLALESFSKAMKLAPEQSDFAKSYALALERAGAGASNAEARARFQREALQLWEKLLGGATRGGQMHLAREARQHIVTLWSLGGTLGERVAPLARRFAATPPDLEAGRLLAETELRLRRYSAAEQTLRGVIRHAPGDLESYQRLERAVIQQGKLDAAIAVLEKLCELDPSRAKEFYQRMASYAADAYQDDRAVRYAARAVELSPEDPEGHQRLGEMYRERQDIERAISEFRKALSQNDRLFAVHFQLAELLLQREDAAGADQLLGQVMRTSPDEQLIGRAARARLQLHLGRGTLEQLERELLPLALSQPSRSIYRKLLIEIYGALAFPLVSRGESSDPETRREAKAALAKLGQRAVKPLLDALGDTRGADQRVAIQLLSHIHNPSAGPALLNFASGEAEAELRLRAVIAAGALASRELLERFEALAFRDGASGSDPVSVAAAWAIARLGGKTARPALMRLLESHAPTLQALAVLGLAQAESPKDAALFARVAGSADYGLSARAAAAFALGRLGDGRATPALLGLAAASDVAVRATATISLARLEAPGARALIASALTSPDPELVAAGVQAACVVGGEPGRATTRSLAVPDGRVDVRELLREIDQVACSADAEAKALVALSKELGEASVQALQGSKLQVLSASSALLDTEGRSSFEPLARRLTDANAELAARARQSLEEIAASVVEPYLSLARHPAPELRQAAVRFLTTRSDPRALEAVQAALEDEDSAVQHTALSGLSRRSDAATALTLGSLLQSSDSWSLRRQTAEALAGFPPESTSDQVVDALARAALADGYALVREAAARALFSLRPRAAAAVLERLASSDPEVQVQNTARKLLQRP